MSNLQLENIPTQLQNLPNWVLWRYEKRNGKSTKVPYQSQKRVHAKSNDPSTWSDFQTALKTLQNRSTRSKKMVFDGLGICLSDELVGIDLDHCFEENGEMKPEARAIVNQFQGTYIEKSPSGHGLRMFCFGKVKRSGKGTTEKWIELYQSPSNRYLTVTGNTLNQQPVTQQPEALDWLHNNFFHQPEAELSRSTTPILTPPSLTDYQLLDKARSARNGHRFDALMSGNTSGYSSRSEADAALCSILAFWSGNNTDQIDRLFRMSGLMRSKWDKKRGQLTYGQMTIRNSLSNQVYSGDSNDTLLTVSKVDLTRDHVTEESPVSCDLTTFDTFDTPQPIPLQTPQEDVPFSLDLIPKGIKEWVLDVCGCNQFDESASTVAAITTLSSVLAKRIVIYPKKYYKGWRVVPNLWGAIVSEPSMQKTPIIRNFIYPLQKYNEQLYKDYLNTKADETPSLTQLIVNDCTPEALQTILAGDKPCALYFRDELSGLLSNLSKSYNEGQRQFLLEGWNGDGHFASYRIGRKPCQINHFALSLFGGIQPAVFSKLKATSDGFLQRFQLLVKVKQAKEYKYVDRAINDSAQKDYEQIFDRFLKIRLGEYEVHFDDPAQEIFNSWFENLENRIRREKHSLMITHLGKYRSLMPSLALLFEAINNPLYRTNQVQIPAVSVESARLAVKFCAFLEQHARGLFDDDGELAPEFSVAQKILDRFQSKKDTTNEVTARDLKRLIRGKNETNWVDKAIEILIDFGYFLGRKLKTGGRFKTLLIPHVSLFESTSDVSKVSTDVSKVSTDVSKVSTDVSKVSTDVSKVSTDVSKDIYPSPLETPSELNATHEIYTNQIVNLNPDSASEGFEKVLIDILEVFEKGYNKWIEIISILKNRYETSLLEKGRDHLVNYRLIREVDGEICWFHP